MRRQGIVAGSLSFRVAGCAGFAIAFAFYAATLMPGVAFWDTGELQTVPYVLGIAHPTGFPLFVLGGWVFAHLVAVGEPAWRLSLFSACASAAASGALAVFVTELAGDAFVGVGAAALFALGDVAWTRGVRADAHDLALCCIAVALAAALRASRDASPRALGWAGLAAGLGLAVHPVTVLALPGVALVAWPALRAVRARTLFVAGSLACAPLAAYAYVPLRSAYVEAHGLDPARALGIAGGAIWDDDAPSSPRSFERYVTGEAFEPGRSVTEARAPGGVRRAYALALESAYREYGDLALALALCGFAYLAVRRPFVATGLLSIGVLDAAFGANFKAESDTARYALAALWAVAACAGAGAWWLARALAGARRTLAPALGCALLVASLWPGAPAAARDVARMRRLDDARAFVADVERSTAPGSLVVATWTYATPLAYRAYVERTFARHLVCAWPSDEASHFAAWRARFGHVYVVVSSRDDVRAFATRVYATDRYQIAEVRS